MAWNELPKGGLHGKARYVGLDRFDLEAEAEGNARKGLAALRPTVIKGKGTIKDGNREGRGGQIRTNKVAGRYVK